MKKGFTLVEMLGVIIVLSLLALIGSTAVTSIVKNSKSTLSNTQLESFKMAAELWAQDNMDILPYEGCTSVSLSDLEDLKRINEVDRSNNPNIDNYIAKVCVSQETEQDSLNIETTIVDYTEYLSCFTTSEVDGGVEINGYSNDCDKSVIIPAKINNKDVVSIASRAFYNKSITSVIIPNKVKSIGDMAFTYNQLNSVSLPSNIETIGQLAFVGNQLTTIKIPDSVTSIGASAFGANQLVKINFPKSLNELPFGIFMENKLTSITIPDNITVIGSQAFRDNLLENVTIPDGVITIDTGAFWNNYLTSIEIPQSVQTIGTRAFQQNLLRRVQFASDGNLTKIDWYAFEENYLKSVDIPNSVTTIEGAAFEYNILEEVTIGNGITYIGQFAFGDDQNEDDGRTYGPNRLINVTIAAPESQVDYWNAFDGFAGTIQFTG